MGSAAIVPAAGRAQRMGRPKWSLPYGADTVLGAVIEALAAGGVNTIALVIPPDDPELAAWARGRPVVTAVNPAPSRGMLSSILVGLEVLGGARAWPATNAALLVCPGDLPALRPATVRKALQTLSTGPGSLVVPTYSGKRGHPLAIGPGLVPEIPRVDPAVGLRDLLTRHPDEVTELPVMDPGCLHDIDTPEDYRALGPHSA